MSQAIAIHARRATVLPWPALGSIVLGVGLAVNSLLGPLAANIIHYRVGETLLSQTIGLDAVSLAIVAPLSVTAGVLALRAHAAGPVLALGPAIYSAYVFPQYIVGPDYLRFPGNNERFFPLYLALVVLGGAVAIGVWKATESERLPAIPRRRARLIGGVLLPIAALLIFSRYLPALRDAMSSSPRSADYLAGPTFFWTIALLDLGIGLPATVATCVGLLRGEGSAEKAMHALVGWLALVGFAVAGMAIAMYARGDPNTSARAVAARTLLALGLTALGAFVYQPLWRRGTDDR